MKKMGLKDKKTMNEKKISFIVCVNNSLYYEECVWYINHLHLLDGYEKDIICITEAESMAQAYNAAMESSSAKYKIYLHQDVFIYHRYFMDDMLSIFNSDDKIGMIGMIGGINLADNAVIWNKWNIGCTYGCNFSGAFPVRGYQNPEYQWLEAEAIDGMLMATQYDVRWREDLELGWDFYDVSQSLEFTKKGYKIVIPYQQEPWCMHDCGRSKLLHYDEARKKMMEEYNERFTAEFVPENNVEYILVQEEVSRVLRKCFELGDLEKALEIGNSVKNMEIRDNDLQYALNMLEIYSAEKNLSEETESFFSGVYTWVELKEKYEQIKFGIRHGENGTNPEMVKELLYLIKTKKISKEAIAIIIVHSAVKKEEAIVRLLNQEKDQGDN